MSSIIRLLLCVYFCCSDPQSLTSEHNYWAVNMCRIKRSVAASSLERSGAEKCTNFDIFRLTKCIKCDFPYTNLLELLFVLPPAAVYRWVLPLTLLQSSLFPPQHLGSAHLSAAPPPGGFGPNFATQSAHLFSGWQLSLISWGRSRTNRRRGPLFAVITGWGGGTSGCV